MCGLHTPAMDADEGATKINGKDIVPPVTQETNTLANRFTFSKTLEMIVLQNCGDGRMVQPKTWKHTNNQKLGNTCLTRNLETSV